jgi:hypothetical protein
VRDRCASQTIDLRNFCPIGEAASDGGRRRRANTGVNACRSALARALLMTGVMASKVWIRWISRIALGVAAAAAFGCASPPGEVVPCSPQDTNGVLCAQVARGETDFHNGALPGLGGNGRACSDCHMDSDSFQLSPTDVETRFQAMSTSGVDDPLFRSIDADDFDTNGDAATDYSNLRQNGLIRVRLPLPANFKLVDPSSCSTDGVAAPCDTAITYALSPATTTDVWRSVPSVFDVKLTGYDAQTPAWPRGPDPQGGYQLDGRADTLQKQALGAFQHHAQVTTDPDEATLDDVAAYEETLLAAPEPALNDLETQGKTIFKRASPSATTVRAWRVRAPTGHHGSLASTTWKRPVRPRWTRLHPRVGASIPARPPSPRTRGRTRSRSPTATRCDEPPAIQAAPC